MPIALLALAIAAFGIGTTEFVIMGLLPEVAQDMGVSISAAGNYISLYALGVVIGAPLLTAAGSRARRKTMLLSTMGLFTVGNLAAALAPTHETLLASRFLSGLPHGAFFGVGAVVAARLADTDKRATAVSRMFIGLTVANIIGVPVGTLLGQQFGWRWTFAMVAVIGVAAWTAVTLLVPQAEQEQQTGLRTELRAFREPQVWLALGVVVFGFGALFSFYSYITPVLTQVTGFAAGAVPILLALMGVGMTVGTWIGGMLADIAPMRTLFAFLSALVVALLAFSAVAQNAVAASAGLFLVGASAFAAIPSIQMRIMDKAASAPSLASASIQSAFNIANSIGAWLGGLVIAGGLGLLAPSWVGAALAAVGIVIAAVAVVLDGGITPRAPKLVASYRTQRERARSGSTTS